jgi:hypothetical protein
MSRTTSPTTWTASPTIQTFIPTVWTSSQSSQTPSPTTRTSSPMHRTAMPSARTATPVVRRTSPSFSDSQLDPAILEDREIHVTLVSSFYGILKHCSKIFVTAKISIEIKMLIFPFSHPISLCPSLKKAAHSKKIERCMKGLRTIFFWPGFPKHLLHI